MPSTPHLLSCQCPAVLVLNVIQWNTTMEEGCGWTMMGVIITIAIREGAVRHLAFVAIYLAVCWRDSSVTSTRTTVNPNPVLLLLTCFVLSVHFYGPCMHCIHCIHLTPDYM